MHELEGEAREDKSPLMQELERQCHEENELAVPLRHDQARHDERLGPTRVTESTVRLFRGCVQVPGDYAICRRQRTTVCFRTAKLSPSLGHKRHRLGERFRPAPPRA